MQGCSSFFFLWSNKMQTKPQTCKYNLLIQILTVMKWPAIPFKDKTDQLKYSLQKPFYIYFATQADYLYHKATHTSNCSWAIDQFIMASLLNGISLINNSKITKNKEKLQNQYKLFTDVITIKHMSIWIGYGQSCLAYKPQKRIYQPPGPPTLQLLGVSG